MAAPSETNSENKGQGDISNKKAPADDEDYGYYFYPGRSGEKKDKSLWKRVWYQEDALNFKCVNRVKSCILSNPMVRLMVGALESHGCPVNFDRHISCETCKGQVAGGFDPTKMQVVVCQNNATDGDVCCNVLAHELLHAFDFCRAKVDFKNIHHLACTEVRAANMNHCSMSAAFMTGEATPWGIKERHQLCVKNKALQSIMLVRDVTREQAMIVVDDVFDKCYNDTEPYGRRCFKDLNRARRAMDQARNYYDFV